MVRGDLITAKLAELGVRLERVRSRRGDLASALARDLDALELVSFNLMLAIQSCTDIASHLIADEGWPAASSLKDAFVRLRDHGVLTPRTAEAMGKAAGFRNVVAHGYAGVQVEVLYGAATEGLSDLEAFAAEIATWLVARLGT